ncbi:aldehyde dehydrogenase (NADP(+)) [Robiginitalea sp. SC105]|uniref:aldehyde dehydrogenase (NADP(+)) n=1 Tax=Robiginitalea sp. SC105 TaxID=2762332 RepID=UPI00163A5652|nr:aldehyde dehydrogenase (NADP(+)) [Robiginitalea sp. SC105]MBC2839334.1 aldehyde dehydrogenase (NADP(+)) [Robiginitalea sp. SC105]
MQQPITGKQLIGFSEISAGQETFQSINPATGEANPWHFSEATSGEIDQAVGLAARSFEAYSRTPGNRRAAFLHTIADQLESDRKSLVAVYMQESGLPEGRANGELGRTTAQLRSFAELVDEGSWVQARIDTAQSDREPLPKPDIRKCLMPLGPVVVFGASNFPFAFSTAGGDTASALAAGCPVVVKGHPMHPATGELVARAVIQAVRKSKMPEGVFSYLQGTSRSLGEQLVKHPCIAAAGFTGSRAGGLALSAIAAGREVPIPFFAEMGSVNPVVLLPTALDPKAGWAKSYAGSVTLGVGQFCTNPGLLFGIEGPGLDRFGKALAGEVAAIPPACMLHPNMAGNFMEMRNALGQQPGVRYLTSDDPPAGTNEVPATVAVVGGSDFTGNPKLQQEVFGPFTLLVSCRDVQELESALVSLEGQLTASVLGTEEEFRNHPGVLDKLRSKAGRILFNGVPTGVEVCPSMHHGGPFPATTDSRYTSVGTDAILRWVRPLSFQNCPQSLLPEVLRNTNPGGVWRLVDGTWSDESIITL